MDASIGTFDKEYDYTYDKFNFDIAKFATPLAASGFGLIGAAIMGFLLAKNSRRGWGVSYMLLTLCISAILFTFSARLDNILDPKNVEKLKLESCYDQVFLEH